jgi:proteic killer suppression protein
MIRSIRHKGLKRFYEDDDPRGIIGQHALKVRDILARLDAATTAADLDLPGFRLHPLKGRVQGILGSDGSGQLAGDFPLCGWRSVRH